MLEQHQITQLCDTFMQAQNYRQRMVRVLAVPPEPGMEPRAVAFKADAVIMVSHGMMEWHGGPVSNGDNVVTLPPRPQTVVSIILLNGMIVTIEPFEQVMAKIEGRA